MRCQNRKIWPGRAGAYSQADEMVWVDAREVPAIIEMETSCEAEDNVSEIHAMVCERQGADDDRLSQNPTPEMDSPRVGDETITAAPPIATKKQKKRPPMLTHLEDSNDQLKHDLLWPPTPRAEKLLPQECQETRRLMKKNVLWAETATAEEFVTELNGKLEQTRVVAYDEDMADMQSTFEAMDSWIADVESKESRPSTRKAGRRTSITEKSTSTATCHFICREPSLTRPVQVDPAMWHERGWHRTSFPMTRRHVRETMPDARAIDSKQLKNSVSDQHADTARSVCMLPTISESRSFDRRYHVLPQISRAFGTGVVKVRPSIQ